MRPTNVWQALAARGFLRSGWPWRSAGYLLTGIPLGIAVLVGLLAALVTGGVLSLVLIGLPLLALTALGGLPVALVERRRLRLVDDAPAADPHRAPAEPGLRAWARLRFTEQATWRELGYTVLFALVLWPLDALLVAVLLGAPLTMAAAPALMATVGHGEEVKILKTWTLTSYPAAWAIAVLGLVLFGVGVYALTVAAGARAALTRLLIAPVDPGLGERVTQLARSRVRLVDAFEAERRRIERDLHDGAQQRLVALSMALGLARLDAPPGPLADQLTKAHEQAQAALDEIRELIHGIHPQVLADYGLEAAVADAADRSPVPVDVTADLPGRLPQPVESAAYFVVCEALANIAKHSGAERAEVRMGHRDGQLTMEISDDGTGGADARDGTGLTGLGDRVSVLDGRLSLSSPVGGPTVLAVEIPVEIPCEWTERCA